MGAILSALFSAVMNGFLKLFMISPDRKLGRLEVQNEVTTKENSLLRKELAVASRPDDSSDRVDSWLSGDTKAANDK